VLSKDSDYFASKSAQRGSKRDMRISQCKICQLGIFDHQQRTWLTAPVIGLVHDDCLAKLSANQ